MNMLRFDGKVAVVTGGGRSIGRAQCLFLAERGAAIVVNDLGGDRAGGGQDPGPAMSVADEIRSSGGRAVVSLDSVETFAGAASIVTTALDAFGRIDILVTNAAIVSQARIGEVSAESFLKQLNVNAVGTWAMVNAVWPHMVEAGYGRIVCINSSAMFGMPLVSAYAFTKAAVTGLVRCASIEGSAHGIKVNALAPAARSRMSTVQDPGWVEFQEHHQRAEFVSPAVAVLSHESCPSNGALFSCQGHRMAEIVMTETAGFSLSADQWTPEAITSHWDAVVDRTSAREPRSAGDATVFAIEGMGLDPAQYGIDFTGMGGGTKSS